MKKLIFTALVLCAPQMHAMQMGVLTPKAQNKNLNSSCCSTAATALCLGALVASASVINGQPANYQGPADGVSGRLGLVRSPAGDYTDYNHLLQMRERYESVWNKLFKEEDFADWDRLIEYEIKVGDDAPFLRKEQERLKTRSVIRDACRTIFWEIEEDKKNQ